MLTTRDWDHRIHRPSAPTVCDCNPYVAHRTPYIRNVLVDGFEATNADRVGLILGLPEKTIDNLQFRNTKIRARTGVIVRHASIKAGGLDLKVVEGPPIVEQRGALVGK